VDREAHLGPSSSRGASPAVGHSAGEVGTRLKDRRAVTRQWCRSGVAERGWLNSTATASGSSASAAWQQAAAGTCAATVPHLIRDVPPNAAELAAPISTAFARMGCRISTAAALRPRRRDGRLGLDCSTANAARPQSFSAQARLSAAQSMLFNDYSAAG